MTGRVVEEILAHRCFERMRTGRCGCIMKKGKHKGENPCQYAEKLARAAEDDVADLDEVTTFLKRRHCGKPDCNHRWCAEISWCLRDVKNCQCHSKAA